MSIRQLTWDEYKTMPIDISALDNLDITLAQKRKIIKSIKSKAKFNSLNKMVKSTLCKRN